MATQTEMAKPRRRVRKGALRPGERPPLIPASQAQRQLWFLDRLAAGRSTAYNMTVALRLRGALDRDALLWALQAIVDRHESLRTHFAEVDGRPVQVIERECKVALPFEDLRSLDAQASDARVRAARSEEAGARFDLATGPLFRMRLLALPEGDHVLLQTCHHIISDAWSQEVFSTELRTLYAAYRTGDRNPLPSLPVQYADYALWQQSWLSEEAIDEELAWWTTRLAGTPDELDIPRDRPRPAVQTFEAATYARAPIDRARLEALRRLGREHGTSMYMTLLGALGVLMARYTGQNDIVIASPFANRDEPQLRGLIGCFLNSVIMRLGIEPTMTPRDLLVMTRQTALEAYQHQDVPFERIVEAIAPARRLGTTPIYQVVFTLQDEPAEVRASSGLDVAPLRGFVHHVRKDLEIHVHQSETRLSVVWIYNPDLFDAWRIEQMAAHYDRVLDALCGDPSLMVGRLNLLTAAEETQLLSGGDHLPELLADDTLASLIEAQVQRTPDAIAVVSEQGGAVSYEALNARANRLSRRLIARGVGPESFVGLALDRSVEYVTAVLATVKAGAAYVPLEPSYPRPRLAWLLADTRPACVLTTRAIAATLPAAGDLLLLLDGNAPSDLSSDNPTDAERVAPLRPSHPAYVIYTSGSSGKPKGVVVTHRGVSSLSRAQQTTLHVVAGARVLQFASSSFDASCWELIMALTTGATLVLVDENSRAGEPLERFLRRHAVSHATLPPAVLPTMTASGVLPLETLVVAGEACAPNLVAQWAPRVRMVNAYGPTETTVCATMSEPLGAEDATPPIGLPLCNTQVRVLDADLAVVPTGVAGELYVAGASLARGYLRLSTLTASRFVADPYGPPGSRMYRTGDVVRWRRNHVLEFVGRVDDQVKIRGFRVEPGEVEAVLRAQDEIVDAAVVAREDVPGERRLVAYVVPRPGERIAASRLQETLSARLPAYLVPSAIVSIPAIPLTSRGKIAKEALPPPELTPTVSRLPRTPEEAELCELFQELLNVEHVNATDDFFALGGHSLLAVSLLGRIRATFGVELNVEDMFETPRVEDLARRLREAAPARPPLQPQSRSGPLLLSYGQQRLWFLDRLRGGSAEYHLLEALRVRGPLDYAVFERTIQTIAARHESLRTHFSDVDGTPVQIVAPSIAAPVAFEELTADTPEALEAQVAAAIRRERLMPIDLTTGPLFRLRVLRVGADDHIMLRTFHHIVSDAWSKAVFNREFLALYWAYREGLPDPLPPLPVQYADFAVWQRAWLDAATLDADLTYWTTQLAGLPDEIALPRDRPRGAEQTFAADVWHCRLPTEQVTALKGLGQAQGATLFMTLLAAFGALLARYSGQDDIVVGSPIANRQDPQLEHLIGFFGNTLALRMRLPRALTFDQLLRQVRKTTLEAYQRQDVPFERVVHAIAPARTLARSPIFQVMFGLQNTPREPARLPGMTIEPVAGADTQVRYDLEVQAADYEGGLGMVWRYNRDLFDRWRIEQMARHFSRIVEAIAADPSIDVRRIPLLDDRELDGLAGWSGAAPKEHGGEATLPALIEAQAARVPDAAAVVFNDTVLSYAALNEQANRVAHGLLARGVGPEQVVGLAMPRSAELIVALAGVLKAGAAYLPLDRDLPDERQQRILGRAKPSLILNDTAVAGEWSGDVPVLDVASIVDASDAASHNPADADRHTPLRPAHPAYAIFTSGSTGEPKGVLVTHEAIVNHTRWMAEAYPLAADDRVLLKTPLTFDASVWEVASPLAAGVAVVVAPPTAHREPDTLVDLLIQHQISVLQTVPSMLAELVRVPALSSARSLRRLFCGGEALDADLARAFRARSTASVHNLYGPTEACIDATSADAQPDAAGTVPIGAPVTGIEVAVLDATLQRVPVGVAGELYVSGAGLARGYLGEPGLTAARFVAVPNGRPGARMYRTGDLVRWRPDGVMEFIGRTDDQVKLRGLRVELGEIESALRAHPRVRDAAAAVQHRGADSAQIVAYVVPEGPDDEGLAGELFQWLRRRLPDYMVPSAIASLDALPVTAHGKLDRAALPVVPIARSEWHAPRTPDEELLCSLFASVLDVDRVGIDDDFFALGGHSLLATRLSSRIAATFRVQVPIRLIFESPTVGALSARVRECPAARPPVLSRHAAAVTTA